MIPQAFEEYLFVRLCRHCIALFSDNYFICQALPLFI